MSFILSLNLHHFSLTEKFTQFCRRSLLNSLASWRNLSQSALENKRTFLGGFLMCRGIIQQSATTVSWSERPGMIWTLLTRLGIFVRTKSKLYIIGLYVWESTDFQAQRGSNTEGVSISRRHLAGANGVAAGSSLARPRHPDPSSARARRHHTHTPRYATRVMHNGLVWFWFTLPIQGTLDISRYLSSK